MTRFLFLSYSVFCYLLFLLTYAWLAGFVGNFAVPVTLDGPARSTLWLAMSVNLALIALFGVQHSVMARPGFKRWWTRIIPEPIERSTYMLASCVCLVALMLLWQPLGGVVWDVQSQAGRAVLWSLFAIGWLAVPGVSLLINHFDLFGLRQAWLASRGKGYRHLPFGTPLAYRFVRHPLYVGWLIAFWATPTMTVTHLIFALGMTAYILIAIPFEERDLIEAHGEAYRRYREQVPALIPTPGRSARLTALAEPAVEASPTNPMLTPPLGQRERS